MALISMVRKMIVQPVQLITSPDSMGALVNSRHYGLLLAALLVIGVAYKPASYPQQAHESMVEVEK